MRDEESSLKQSGNMVDVMEKYLYEELIMGNAKKEVEYGKESEQER